MSDDLQDLRDRLRPLVADALSDVRLSSTASQFDELVAQLATELRRDLGVQ